LIFGDIDSKVVLNKKVTFFHGYMQNNHTKNESKGKNPKGIN